MSAKPKKNTKSKGKTEKPKKEKKLKIYCGIDETPKNSRIGSMKECADAGQIRYYGLHKIDKRVVNSSIKVSINEEKILRVKLAGLKGSALRLAKDYKIAKTEKNKKQIMDEYKIIKQQIVIVQDKINKIEEKQKKQKK